MYHHPSDRVRNVIASSLWWSRYHRSIASYRYITTFHVIWKHSSGENHCPHHLQHCWQAVRVNHYTSNSDWYSRPETDFAMESLRRQNVDIRPKRIHIRPILIQSILQRFRLNDYHQWFECKHRIWNISNHEHFKGLRTCATDNWLLPWCFSAHVKLGTTKSRLTRHNDNAFSLDREPTVCSWNGRTADCHKNDHLHLIPTPTRPPSCFWSCSAVVIKEKSFWIFSWSSGSDADCNRYASLPRNGIYHQK